MTDKPQLTTEEIELIPHPMDAWRAALNALIAYAPGDGPAIAVHLAEARQQAMVFVDRTTATPGTRKLVDRLMLIGAGRIVGERIQAHIGLSFQGKLDPFVPTRMPNPASPDALAQPADVRPIETFVGRQSVPLRPARAVPVFEPEAPMHMSSQPGEFEAHQCSGDPA